MRSSAPRRRRVVRGRSIMPLSLLAPLCALTVLGALGLAFDTPLLHGIARTTSQLAQIVSVDITVLKQWQKRGGLLSSLSPSSRGPEVALLQRVLSQDQTAYPEKKVTGVYGEKTTAAVLAFQKRYNLKETGIVDDETRNKLNALFFSQLCPEAIKPYPEFFLHAVDHSSPLPLDYVPPNLQDISGIVPTAGIACLRGDVVHPLSDMFKAAHLDGVSLMVTSAYRKPQMQQYLYDFWIQTEGETAKRDVAQPGFSEHQLGTTVDLTDSSIGYESVDPRFATSNGGIWMQKNAYKYGFVLSYPSTDANTGYIYEPWHYRYVGINVASHLHTSGGTFNASSYASRSDVR